MTLPPMADFNAVIPMDVPEYKLRVWADGRALQIIDEQRNRIRKLEVLIEWCKPDDDSPPEHWEAFHAVQQCPECEQYDKIHDQRCRLHPDYDPTP